MMPPRHGAARAALGEPGQVLLAGSAQAASLVLALVTEEARAVDGAQQASQQTRSLMLKVKWHDR